MRLTTTDLYESSYLHCSGARLADAWRDRGNRSTVVFAFEDEGSNRLLRLQTSYHDGAATVNLADYRRSLETLKDVMFRILKAENLRARDEKRKRTIRN